MVNLKKVLVLIMCMCFTTTALLADYSSGSCTGSISVTFRNAEFVTGLGWRTGTSRTINFSGSCSGCFWGPGVYGWMTNPLIEYYIGKSGGSSKGSYSCNGRSYTLEIYRQRGKPSIVGTADFDQYNCKGSRNSPVDMGCHLDAWKSLGAAVGTHDYQVVMAEGFGGSTGSSNISVSNANWYTHWTNGGSVDFKCTGGGTDPTPTPATTPEQTPVTTPEQTPVATPTKPPAGPVNCSNAPSWESGAVYENAGMRVVYNGKLYENNWYSSGQNPEQNSGEFDVWKQIGTCDPSSPTAVPSNNKGDVNEDGIINIVDALLTAQYCVGLNPSGFNRNLADSNCDSTINIVDALIIAQYYVGLISRFC